MRKNFFTICCISFLMIFITACDSKQPRDDIQFSQQNAKTRDPFSPFEQQDNNSTLR